MQLLPGDFYLENGFMVFTAQYHLRRGTCCGSGCRHCPWAEARDRKNQQAAVPDRGAPPERKGSG